MYEQRVFEGTLTRVTDGGVDIDFNGRMGRMTIPLRMLVCDDAPMVGQTVRFVMSYPEVINRKGDDDLK